MAGICCIPRYRLAKVRHRTCSSARADGSERRQITNVQTYDSLPSFSHDGTKIVFARAARHRPYSMGGWTWDHWDVFTVNADGSGLKQITHEKYHALDAPQWSPDGTKILFSAPPPPSLNYDVFVVDAHGTKPARALTTDGRSNAPSFSPDGRNVVFISDVAVKYDYEVWRMNADGTHRAQITHNKSYNQRPVFTPDGKRIVFQSDPGRSQKYDLWQTDSDGGNPRQIADSSLFDDPMHWKKH